MADSHHTRPGRRQLRRRAAPAPPHSLHIEPLEDRRLLALAATVEVFPMGSIHNSSTASADSFRIHNTSTEARSITSVTIDLRPSLLPDVVYDPDGTGGDVVGIPFTPNTGAAATGQTSHTFSLPRDGGYDALTVAFNDFDPGETFTFRVDLDPTSVKGSAQPGPDHVASVSGLEISGALVTVLFDDGSRLSGQLFALEENAGFYRVHAEAVLTEDPPLAAPAISLVGVTTPAVVAAAAQTVRIAGPVGAAVRLLQTEVALHLAGVPGGGYDIDPFEGNKVVDVRDSTATIGAAGFVDVPITLRDTLAAGGLTYLAAVIDAGPRTGPVSNVLKVALVDLPPGSSSVIPLAGDLDADADVDGADLLLWQRGAAAPGGLIDWRTMFGQTSPPANPASTLAYPAATTTASTAAPQLTPLLAIATQPEDDLFRYLGQRLRKAARRAT